MYIAYIPRSYITNEIYIHKREDNILISILLYTKVYSSSLLVFNVVYIRYIPGL